MQKKKKIEKKANKQKRKEGERERESHTESPRKIKDEPTPNSLALPHEKKLQIVNDFNFTVKPCPSTKSFVPLLSSKLSNKWHESPQIPLKRFLLTLKLNVGNNSNANLGINQRILKRDQVKVHKSEESLQ